MGLVISSNISGVMNVISTIKKIVLLKEMMATRCQLLDTAEKVVRLFVFLFQ